MELNELSLTAVAELISSREVSACDVLDACLKRIDQREESVGAFEYLDKGLAGQQASRLHEGPMLGSLHGIPVGIKDIIDTADMPTAWGSPIYTGHRPVRDAGCVTALRRAGAIIAGKTVTTEFAYFYPGKTRNPHNLNHTPGGSSMGSAAAVADMMLPAALGSQTAASVIRPAAYCGVVGYKSTQGAFDLGGVCGLSPTMDSLGFLVREPVDLHLLRKAYLGAEAPVARSTDEAPRIGLVRTPHWNDASPETQSLLKATAAALESDGAEIRGVEIGPTDGALTDAQKTVMAFETARARVFEFDIHRDELSDAFRSLVEEGLAVDFAKYKSALDLATNWSQRLEAVFAEVDFLLAPSAPGEAPEGLTKTGDPLFSRMWNLLRVPSITLPAGVGPNGLPLGIQLIGACGEDDRLIRDADWVWERL
jgi:Asp-tRNA(Asn)/Glu-tRNA(Gln) amidotransferase A subunit family amidase